jgi:hypothetical protein
MNRILFFTKELFGNKNVSRIPLLIVLPVTNKRDSWKIGRSVPDLSTEEFLSNTHALRTPELLLQLQFRHSD